MTPTNNKTSMMSLGKVLVTHLRLNFIIVYLLRKCPMYFLRQYVSSYMYEQTCNNKDTAK